MSSVKARHPGRRDLRAAIQWDVPALRASRHPSAGLFLNAMAFHVPDVHSEPAGEDSLIDAVVGLAKEFSGDREGARAVYQIMQAADYRDVSDLAHLLAAALLAWTAPDDARKLLEDAAGAITGAHGATFRANYLLKLAGFALNLGDRQLARSMVERARTETITSSPRLHWRTEVLLAWLDGRMLMQRAPRELDRFADFPWISADATRAARKALVQTAEDLASNPWARTIRFGLTPVDSSTATAIQAEWAGALWLLPALRLQNAAQILVQGGRAHSEWVECAADWVLGGGQQLNKVLDHLEAHFEVGSVTLLLTDRLRHGARLDDPKRIASVLAELWDLLSPEEADAYLDLLDPPAENVLFANDVRNVWGLIGAIIPDGWSRRFLDLDRSQQLALLPHLSMDTVPRLPREARTTLVNLFLQAVSPDAATAPYGAPWALGAALLGAIRNRDEVGRLVDRLAAAPEGDRLAMAAYLPIHAEALHVGAAIDAGREALGARADAARKGEMSVGGTSPANALALGLRIYPHHPDATDILRELVAVAADPEVLLDVRVEALHGLRYVAPSFGQLIDPSPLRELRFSRRTDFGLTSMAPDVAQALATCVTLVADSSPFEPGLLASLVRANDERIREIAVDTAGDLLSAGPKELIEATLLGALYDPSRNVVIAALRSMERADVGSSAFVGPLTQRVVSLFHDGTRAVRSRIAHLVSVTYVDTGVGPDAQALLGAARADRSWRVRQAAGS